MSSYEVRRFFVSFRLPPFPPWVSGYVIFSLGLCCLPLWQSSLVLRLLYIFWNPSAGHILWRRKSEALLQDLSFGSSFAEPFFQIGKPFCKAFFLSSDAWSSFFLVPALFPLGNVPSSIISTRPWASGSFPTFGGLCLGFWPQVGVLLGIAAPGHFSGVVSWQGRPMQNKPSL